MRPNHVQNGAPALKRIASSITAAISNVQARRKPFTPLYPYDKRTNTISLSSGVEKEIRHLVLARRKPEALKKVANLTGASLRISKDYIDGLPGGGRKYSRDRRKRMEKQR